MDVLDNVISELKKRELTEEKSRELWIKASAFAAVHPNDEKTTVIMEELKALISQKYPEIIKNSETGVSSAKPRTTVNGIELDSDEKATIDELNFKSLFKNIFKKTPAEKQEPKAKNNPSKIELLKKFYREAKQDDKKLVKASIRNSLLHGISGGMLPLFNGQVLSALGVRNYSAFASWMFAYTAGMAGNNVIASRAAVARQKLRTMVASNSVIRKFMEIRHNPMQFFYQKNNQPAALQKRINNVASSQSEYIEVAGNVLAQASGVVTACGVLFYTSPLMGSIAAGATALYAGGGNWLVKQFKKAHDKSRNVDAKNSNTVIDVTRNIDMLKRYQQTDKATEIIAGAQKKSKLFSDKIYSLANKCNNVMDSFTNIAVLGIAGVYGAMMVKETGDIGQFSVITGATMTMVSKGMFAASCWRRLGELKNQYVEENAKLQPSPKMQVKSGEKQLQANNSKIEIKNVSFMYPDYEQEGKQRPQKPADNQKENGFKGIVDASVSFEKGRLQTIIGRSGQGKSTLLHLMAHVYDVDAGEITIGGVNVNETSEETIHGYMGIMSQKDDFLNTLSIRENLEMLIPNEEDLKKAKGKLEKGEISQEQYERMCEFHNNPQEKIDDALKRAQIYDTYYDTPNGKPNYNKGYKEFSGGEAQRLMLARAILADNEIIVLDEPTSALDTKTAMELTVELKKLAQEKNVIVVTHAPDIVANSDKVVVVENGHITGDGSPFTLCQTNEYFKSQYKPAEILNARKKYMECASEDDLEISKKLVAQNRIDATYGNLKNALNESPKKLFQEMRSFVQKYHSEAPDDVSRAVQKQILEDEELGQAYVKASKQKLKKRRSAKEGR